MEEKVIEETALALASDWGIQMPDLVSEETILERLTQRVEALVKQGAENFFQLMYRLDISEQKLKAVMHQPDVAAQVARLIYNRQVQKIITRRELSKRPQAADPDLEW